MARRGLPWVLSLLLLVVAAWLFHRSRHPQSLDESNRIPQETDSATHSVNPPAPASAGRQRIGKDATPTPDGSIAASRDRSFRSRLSGFRGRLVDGRGNALAGLTVQCRVLGRPLRPWTRVATRSGSDGRFVIDGLWPSGHVTVQAGQGSAWLYWCSPGTSGAGERFARTPGVVHDVGDLTLARCGSVTGIVQTPEGASVANAIVEITEGLPRTKLDADPTSIGRVVIRATDATRVPDGHRTSWRRRVVVARTDATGRFRADRVRVGDLEITFQLPGRFLPSRRAARSRAERESDLGEFRFPSGTIAVRVVDGEGQPVPNSELAVNGVSVPVRSPQGRFVVAGLPATPEHLPVERITLAARRPHGTWTVKRVEPNTADEHVVELDALVSVRYRVRDPEGDPVEDVTVTFDPARTDAERSQDVSPDAPRPVAIEAVREGDGVFVVHGLEPRPYRITARRVLPKGELRGESYYHAKKKPGIVEIHLGHVHDVRIVAVDEADRPVSYACVEIGNEFRGYTDEAGSLETTIFDRGVLWGFEVEHPRYERFFTESAAESGEVRAVMRRELTLFGRVIFEHEPPKDLTGWFVMVESKHDALHQSANLRVDGTFAIRRLPRDVYRIGGLYDGQRPVTFRMRTPPTKQFDFRENRTIEVVTDWQPPKSRGRIRGRILLNGKPAAGAIVEAPHSPVQGTCTVDGDGRFELGPVLHDPVRLEIKREIQGDGTVRLWEGLVEMSRVRGRDLELALHTGVVRGRVLDTSGRPVRGARVIGRARIDVDGIGNGLTWCSVPADESGNFVLPMMCEGLARIDAWTDGRAPQGGLSTQLRVLRGITADGVVVTVRRLVQVAGTLDFERIGFRPGANTEVSLRLVTTTREAWADRLPGGGFRVERLLPGTYRAVLLFEDQAQSSGMLRLVHPKPVEVGRTNVDGLLLRFGEAAAESWRREAETRGVSLAEFVARYGLTRSDK